MEYEIGPSPDWGYSQFVPSPFGFVTQPSFHEQTTAVAAIENYVKSEFNDKPIKWVRPYDLKNSHCQLKPIELNEQSLQSIKGVINPLHNSNNEKCARIRVAFIKNIDESLAKYYFVTGERGETKKFLCLVRWFRVSDEVYTWS